MAVHKLTLAYVTKRNLITALTAQTATGQPLAGVQVQYARDDKRMERKCIYGGGIRFTQQEDAAEGARLVVLELVTIGLYIRIQDPGADVQGTDLAAEGVADALTDVLAANPQIAGPHTWIGIGAGQGDYAPNEDGAVTNVGLQLQFQGYVT